MPDPADPLPAPEPALLPPRIGRYEVVRELGRGTMGIVYEAKDPILARTVALKTIDRDMAAVFGEEENFEQRFFAEARIAVRVSHPGIVGCYDVGKDADSGTLFIVLEYLQGRTLADHMKARGAMPWYEAVPLLAGIARAIDHAHRQGVIHRDLKPANIMLLDSGDPKIMDFGIAKVETGRFKQTATGHFFGSPLYMSPEQALGDPLDARTDVFSLGSILCSLLVGRNHFAAPSIPDILTRILHEEPPTLRDLIPGVPAALEHVVRRAMAKAPADRYTTAAAMADDLEDVLASRPLRHTANWTPPAPAEKTVVRSTGTPPPRAVAAPPELAGDPVLEASALEPLAPEPPVVRPQPTPIDRRPPSPAPSVRPTRRRLIAGAPAMLWLAVVLAAVVVAALWAMRGHHEPPMAETTAPTAAPTRTRIAEVTVAATEAPTDTSTPAPEPSPSPASDVSAAKEVPTAASTLPSLSKSHLHVVMEHSIKSGRLRVWIDGEPAVDARLEAAVTRKIVALKIRSARVDKTLEVEPGKHAIRVAVHWDDDERVEATSATFVAQHQHELEIKLGRLRKDLTLEWK